MTAVEAKSRCPGPHDENDRPETSEPLCGDCQYALHSALGDMPTLYARLWLALESGMRPAPPGNQGGRVKQTHAPLQLDGGADAMMRRCVDILGCWMDVVSAAVPLSEPLKRSPRTLRVATRLRLVVKQSDYPARDDDEDRPEYAVVEAHQGFEAVDRPVDSMTGYLISHSCAVLRTHLQTLIRLPATPVMRRRQISELAAMTDEAVGSLVTTVNADECLHLLDLTGVDAAKELLDLRRSIRRFLGDTRGCRVGVVPCPDEECRGALVMWDGDEHVECVGCRREWSPADYERLILVTADEARASGRWEGTKAAEQLVTQARAAELAAVEPVTVRSWVHRGLLTQSGRDGYNRATFRLGDVLAVAKSTQIEPRGRRRKQS